MAQVFTDDDHGYKRWKFAHPRGFVVNAGRPPNPANTLLHEASCKSISGEAPAGGSWTTSAAKVCGDSIEELERWAHDAIDGDPAECPVCTPYRNASARHVEPPSPF